MSRISSVCMLSMLGFALSCKSDEVTAFQSKAMTLTFTPDVMSGVGARTPEGNLRCNADMTIFAHGTSDHLLSLQSIATTFTDSSGATGNTINSSPLDWFGVGTLKRNETAVAHRQPTGPGPFSLVTSLTYRDQFGASKVTTFTMTCSE